MPELPEIEALAAFLRENAVGRVVSRVDVTAINAVKTFDPPLHALLGLTVTGVARFGKFLDLQVDGLHLITHFSRAGWLQWREALPAAPPKPGRGTLAVRVHLASADAAALRRQTMAALRRQPTRALRQRARAIGLQPRVSTSLRLVPKNGWPSIWCARSAMLTA